MSIIQSCGAFPSVSGLADIYVRNYIPQQTERLKGIVQIAHGMAEHSRRYARFAEFLCQHGYVVVINDHLGHGKSVLSRDKLGFFGDGDGVRSLVEDMHHLSLLARERFPDLPLFLFGHSMGSLLARSYAAQYGEQLSGAIFCATSGPNPAAKPGFCLACAVGRVKGAMHRSPLIDRIAFGGFNQKIPGAKTKFDWLSSDGEVVTAYVDDPLCGFLFTAAGYRDLFRLLMSVSATEWFEQVPKDLPLLFVSGQDDPVGDYGKGVEKVFDTLKSQGQEHVERKFYPHCRHEILNETSK
ncbi:MAG: lysophospholipase [Oscillospiraceae bacterium]|jgi:alpha-beta hydrolase superfamily lysophospholipase|nr:lysophospholipase [Oscillospiraceae bacterium]